MNWMIENKEWLFSGLLVAVPLAALGFLFSRNNSKQVQKSGKNSTNIQVGGSFNVGTNKDDR